MYDEKRLDVLICIKKQTIGVDCGWQSGVKSSRMVRELDSDGPLVRRFATRITETGQMVGDGREVRPIGIVN